MIQEALKKIGLDDKEIQTYLALLEISPSPASNISNKTKIQRELTYAILSRLENKGIASHAIKNGKKQFFAAEPKDLLEQIEEKRQLFKEIVPSLEKIKNKKQSTAPTTETFESAEGVKTALNKILNFYENTKSTTPLLGYGSAGKLETVLKWSFPHFIDKRVKTKIKFKGIYNKTKEGLEKKQLPLSNIRFLPKEAESPSFYLIYPENVVIIIFNKDPIAVIIHSQEIFESYTTYFNILWKTAESK
jgi:sugar-specific transcriptional regulator TrmB